MSKKTFSISYVSKLLATHPQTVRQYEKYGLIKPKRTSGNIRVYKQEDIELLKMIIRLTRDLGVNLAGVDIILRLKNDVKELENKIETLNKKSSSMDCVVPKNKSLVQKDGSHDIIISQA
jgi:MerR family transcriptional regulator/heat shock protein HspR